MQLFSILKIPDPRLEQVAQPVVCVDDAIRVQMDRMLATMYAAPGIGLAANQVGILNRVVVIDVTHRGPGGEKTPIFMANPEIIAVSQENCFVEEGCLSVPGHRAAVERPVSVTVQYLDYNNQQQTLETDGLMARCIQHEVDHLDGIRFIDHLPEQQREQILLQARMAENKANFMNAQSFDLV